MTRLLYIVGSLVFVLGIVHFWAMPKIDAKLPTQGYLFWWVGVYAAPLLGIYALIRHEEEPAYVKRWSAVSLLGGVLLYVGAVTFLRGAQLEHLDPYEAFLPTNNFAAFATVSIATTYFYWQRLLRSGQSFAVGRRPFRARGRISLEEVAEQIARAREGKGTLPGVVFGTLQLPDSVSPTHFYVTGAPGSGKTITIQLILASAMLHLKERPGTRLVVYDPKRELVPFLASLAPEKPLVLINPFDERSVPWAISRDMETPAAAIQLANLLIPDVEGGRSDPYWTDTPRHLLSGIVVALQKTVGPVWTLRDILLIARDPETLKRVLASCPQTTDRLQHFGIERTTATLLSALNNALQRYEVVAALWDFAVRDNGRRPVALSEFLAIEAVLILGNDPQHGRSVAPINRLLVERLSDLIRSLPEARKAAVRVPGLGAVEPRTWVVIDEAVTVGKLPGLKNLMAEGRSKGACVVLGFQDIHDLYDVYGENGANGILGQCANKAILRVENGTSAEILSRQFQRREVVETSVSETLTKEGRQPSMSERIGEEQIVLPKEILDLPRPGPGPIEGFFKTAVTDVFRASTPFGPAMEIASQKGDVREFIPLPLHAQELIPFDDDDRKRLGLTGFSPPSGGSIFDAIGGRHKI